MSRSHSARMRRPMGRAGTLFAALLAVFLQAFVVQTHVHASGVMTVAAHEQSIGVKDGGVHLSNGQDHAKFAICDIIISVCHSTLAVAPVIAERTIATNEATALAIRRAPRALTHTWQSRAPPIAL